MREKIVLIDGHSILNRAFYGIPDLTNQEGLHTNGIYGFLNIMFKILEEEKPEYLAVAFDVHAPTFRHEMFAEYKGTRKGMPEELIEQVPVMKDVLKAMGITVVEKEGFEADDILGTLSARCEKAGLDVVIISGDRDILQTATEHVKIRIPKTKKGGTTVEDYLADDVKRVYQVTPKEFIDVKALMGDASDNIPGVPSIGEKTATKIIVEYGSLENAYAHVEELKPPRASKALKEYYDQAVLSKELATILLDVPIDFSYKDAKVRDFYTKEAFVYFQRLQFKNFLERFEVNGPVNKVFEHVVEVTTKEDMNRVIDSLSPSDEIGVSFICQDGEMEMIGIARGEKEVMGVAVSEQLTGVDLASFLRQVLEKTKKFSIFDYKKHLHQWRSLMDFEAFDIKIGAYLLDPLKSDYTVGEIGQQYKELYLESDLTPLETICFEAYICCETKSVIEKRLKEEGMWSLYSQIEMPLCRVLFEMEEAGIKVQGEELADYGKMLSQNIQQLEKEIYDMAGEEFNINSPKQLGTILFEKLQLPHGKKNKSGYSTAADILEKLEPEYPIVHKVLLYRQLTKLKSTYADGLSMCISSDGRIHGTFHQTVTATGRISSADPNLQNIPVRMEMGRRIRKVFVPKEGCVFIDADYSQIELRILAHCANDEALIKAYQEARDIHKVTASQVFHTPFEEVTDLQRRNAKAVNFGIVYGISSFGLSQDLSITRKEAKEYIDRYFETYPGIKTFLDEAVQTAKEQGYVTTLFGRIRPIPELQSKNFMQRSFGERVAMNSPIQGTAADIMKIAMIKVNEAFKREKMASRIVLQVHDELLVEAPIEEKEKAKQIVKENMESAALLKVPLLVDMSEGNSWFEAK